METERQRDRETERQRDLGVCGSFGFSVYRSIGLSVYQFFFVLFGAVYLAVRLARGRELPGIRERLASYSPEVRERLARMDRPVWIHAVSVGEVLASRPLVEELRRRFPGKAWVVSTVTPTGREVAQKHLQDSRTEVIYLPWDLGPVVGRAIKAVRPALFLSFETELWPVLFDKLGRAGIPVAVVNGRISPRAYRRYLWIRPLMQRALEPVGLFLTQSPQDARRYAALGAAKDRIVVSGNMKWDLIPQVNGQMEKAQALRAAIGLTPGKRLWVAGSTHAREEFLILQAYSFVRRKFPELKLLLAPRHPERVVEIEQEVWASSGEGWTSARYSSLKQNGSTGRTDAPIVILDTVGDLKDFYPIADIVFMGGSLVPHGGHNLVEPASFSRPILSGPYLQNFQAISELLLQAKGMLIVRTPKEIEEAVSRLLGSPAQARDLGLRAQAVFRENQGAVRRTADLIGLRWGRVLS